MELEMRYDTKRERKRFCGEAVGPTKQAFEMLEDFLSESSPRERGRELQGEH